MSISRCSRAASLTRTVLLCIVAIAFAAAPAGAQVWELGHRRFVSNSADAARPLQMPPSGRAGLASFSVVSRVGGVSFEAVAEPDKSLAGKALELAYDPSKPDGSRLVVKAG